LIVFDRRGTGGSDSVPRNALPTWEEWTDDVQAVLDAVGSETAAIVAVLDAAPIAILFAAMHPERVSALVLVNASARYLVGDEYPIGASKETVDALVEVVGQLWGTPDFVHAVAPSMADDVGFASFLAKQLRAAATPRTAVTQVRYILESLDVRSALPHIQAPTLVLHFSENQLVPVEHGRYIADHISGATLVELPSADGAISPASYDIVASEIAAFLTGERPTVDVDRVLTTVLFTDIVDSTTRLVALGDRRWRSLLDAHDRVSRRQLRRFGGREITTTGDGFFASFDGPARAIRCARAMIDAVKELGIDLRAGLHTGECEVRGSDLSGLAVHIAARVGSVANAGEVLITRTVGDLVAGSGILFENRGLRALKGIPEDWHLLSVTEI
jgi:class 3 adenylate cyclase